MTGKKERRTQPGRPRWIISAVLACAAGSFPVASPQAGADIVQINPVADNSLYQSDVGDINSNGAGEYLYAGMPFGVGLRRGLLRFDIAGGIPAGSTIESVTLGVSVSRSISGDLLATLHRVTASWGEADSDAGSPGGIGAPAQIGDATWNHRFYDPVTPVPWGTPGGDFLPAVSASALIGSTGPYLFASTTPAVTDVQNWLDAPLSNFGWLLRVDESFVGGAKRFDSRENLIPGNRPILTVTYSPVPEPATWVMFIVGGTAMLLRPRRQRG